MIKLNMKQVQEEIWKTTEEHNQLCNDMCDTANIMNDAAAKFFINLGYKVYKVYNGTAINGSKGKD